MKENIINDWLLKNQNPEIDKQVEMEAEQIMQNQQLSQTTVSGSNSTLYSQCCNENPILRKIDDVEYYECPYCKQKCEVEWQEDEFPDYCH